jgi:tetratricopeptide (TPR) repeat protein/DNA-binding CsgD family transcriptional regulator
MRRMLFVIRECKREIMLFDEFILPQEIYAEHLKTINNIKLSKREIDIIACILSGRSAKGIAHLLSISPHTVETHTRNILRKLDCPSREGIINFIEAFHKLSVIRQYYSSLLSYIGFEQTLKEISKLKSEDGPICLIVCWREHNPKNLIHHLETHLRLAGINASIEVRDQVQSFSQIIHESREGYMIYVVPKEWIVKQRVDKKIPRKNSILFLLLGKDNLEEITEEDMGYEYINLAKQKNYYFLFFEILKKICPNLDLEKIISEFREKYEALQSPDISHHVESHSGNKESVKEENNFNPYKIPTILRNRRTQFLLALSLVFISGIGLLLVPRAQVPENQSPSSIRSDLMIPTDSAFLQRSELMAQIDNKFKGQHRGIQTVALVGIGGAGKTTLARQYAKEQKESVVWEVNAETQESLMRSFENLAYFLSKTEEDKKILTALQEIKAIEEKEEKILQFVKERLRTHSNWLLIYDNVEKFADIQKYFPKDENTWGQGRIILTTRDGNIQNNKLVTYSVPIRELNPDQKLDLFKKIMNASNFESITFSQNEVTKKFLKEIPPFPLDVSTAAYYLRATNIPYDTYLKNVTHHNKDFENVQENLLRETGDYTKTRYNIITLSLQHLIDTHKDFAELLLFISFLDSQNIPRDLLEKFKNNVVVDNLIYNLKKYSLITYKHTHSSNLNSFFSIHRSTQSIVLIHLVKKLDLEKNNLLLKFILIALEKYLADLIEKNDLEKMQNLASHTEMFLTHRNFLTDDMRGSLRGMLGCIYQCLGTYTKAKKNLEEGYKSLSGSKKKKYALMAQTAAYLGASHKVLGDYSKAKTLLEQSLTIYKEYILEPNTSMAWVLMNLGDTYRNLGYYAKAETVLREALIIYKKNTAKNQSALARALSYLGNFYRDLGNYEEAKHLLEESLDTYQKYASQDRLGMARIAAYVGDIHRKLGNYVKAITLSKKSLTIYQEYFPEDHLNIAWALRYLGNAYRSAGEYEKARGLLEKCLAIYKSKNHIDVACVSLHLGNVYKNLGDYEKAKQLLQISLTGYENQYGKDHLKTGPIFGNLGQIYLLEGRLEEAENMLNRALRIFQRYNHLKCYITLESLAALYLRKSQIAEHQKDMQQAQNFKVKAREYLKQALEIVKTHFSKDSPHIIRIQSKLNECIEEAPRP